MRLIDADALLKQIGNAWEYANPMTIIDLITNAPTIEADSGEAVASLQPVAYMNDAGFAYAEFKEDLDPYYGKIIPLYTSPQKQWVGLSHDDFNDASWFTDEFIEGANWAQNKLKELNT